MPLGRGCGDGSAWPGRDDLAASTPTRRTATDSSQDCPAVWQSGPGRRFSFRWSASQQPGCADRCRLSHWCRPSRSPALVPWVTSARNRPDSERGHREQELNRGTKSDASSENLAFSQRQPCQNRFHLAEHAQHCTTTKIAIALAICSPTSRERRVNSASGQLFREGPADAGGCAGDQCGGHGHTGCSMWSVRKLTDVAKTSSSPLSGSAGSPGFHSSTAISPW